MRICHIFVCSAASLAVLTTGSLGANPTDPLSILFPHQWIGDIDQIGFPEPSGIVFHEGRGTLFVVSDEGEVCEMKTDGTPVKEAQLRMEWPSSDFEGITYDPATGLLYIAVETVEEILEVDPDDLKIVRQFNIERSFQGKLLMNAEDNGIEAITFVPNPNHPHGGTFYVANQSFTLDNEDDVSAIFELEVPLRDKGAQGGRAKILRWFSLGVTDLSALNYDRATEHLYVLSDANNVLLEITRDGEILRSWAFPGDNQEGLGMDNEGHLYIAQDSGGIIKIKRM